MTTTNEPGKRTTAASFTVEDGYLVLSVHELTDDFQVVEHSFNVDAYGLPLAANLLAALNEQQEQQQES